MEEGEAVEEEEAGVEGSEGEVEVEEVGEAAVVVAGGDHQVIQKHEQEKERERESYV